MVSEPARMLAGELNLSITAGLQRIKIYIIKSILYERAVFCGTLFSLLYIHILWYILVYGTKKERTKPGSRFFLFSASSIEKVDALKPHYYDKKKFPVLQDNSYKKNICPAF